MAITINQDLDPSTVKHQALSCITQMSKLHNLHDTMWLETKNKINKYANAIIQKHSSSNSSKVIIDRLQHYTIYLEQLKNTSQIETHFKLQCWVNYYVYQLNGTLEEMVDSFPKHEQTQFLRQIAAFRPGSDPANINQIPLQPQLPHPTVIRPGSDPAKMDQMPLQPQLSRPTEIRPGSDQTKMDQMPLQPQLSRPTGKRKSTFTPLPTIFEVDETSFCDEAPVEPKSSTDLFDNIAAAHCLATLSSELTQTKRKKSGLTQTKRKKSKLTHTKRKKIDVPTNPIVISPQKKHAAHKLLLMKIHGQPLSPRTI